mgnify:CR=1 FL=1
MGAEKQQHHALLEDETLLTISKGIQLCTREMLNADPVFNNPFETPNWKSNKDLSTCVLLDSAPYSGLLIFYFDKPFVELIAKTMTGVGLDSDLDYIDSAGEIGNIFYGNIKTLLNKIGFQTKMNSPTAEWTKNLVKKTDVTHNCVLEFDVLDHKCQVEVVVYR